jgi:hypothetical protein
MYSIFLAFAGFGLIILAGFDAGRSFTKVSFPKTEYDREIGINGVLLSLAILFLGFLFLFTGSLVLAAEQAQSIPREMLAAALTLLTPMIFTEFIFGMFTYFLLAFFEMKMLKKDPE